MDTSGKPDRSIAAELTGFARLDGSHGPEWVDKVEIHFVITREQATGLVRTGDVWTLVPPEAE